MTKQLFFSLMVIVFTCTGVTALAQDEAAGGDPVSDIENLFSKEEEAPPAKATPAPEAQAGDAKPAVVEAKEIRDVTDLSKLQAFKDIAVIQKRYLPKSQRFEFYVAPTLNLNDAFFLSYGGNARLGYYFTERYGIEGSVTYLNVSSRQVVEDLSLRKVATRSFVTPKAFYGLDFKWVPIYGKMSWRNRKITPFDLYFAGGIYMANTNQGGNEPALHFATGQNFALSKSSAVRWDFSWFAYMATTKTSDASEKTSTALYHNLLISVGYSFFFPEATYR